MTLSGSMSVRDMKRVVSLFSSPQAGTEEPPVVMADEPTAAATNRYMAAVRAILDDIKYVKDSPNYDKTAT